MANIQKHFQDGHLKNWLKYTHLKICLQSKIQNGEEKLYATDRPLIYDLANPLFNWTGTWLDISHQHKETY